MENEDDETYAGKLEPIATHVKGCDRLLFISDIKEIIRVPPLTVRRWVVEGTFPKPVPMGHKRGPNRIAWIASEVQAWIDRKIAARDGV